MKDNFYIVKAAGGNVTAILILDEQRHDIFYQEKGKQFITSWQHFQVEQVGFLFPGKNLFRMSGGEFCGNAARAAAFILSLYKQKLKLSFFMYGVKNPIDANLVDSRKKEAYVSVDFKGLPIEIISSTERPGKIHLVDLGGIVHIVVFADFPENYQSEFASYSQKYDLERFPAIGVIWCKKVDGVVKIDPVVWVRSINTFFYEGACGSGSIAAAKVCGVSDVLQPTGEKIKVDFDNETTRLASKIEIAFSTFCNV